MPHATVTKHIICVRSAVLLLEDFVFEAAQGGYLWLPCCCFRLHALYSYYAIQN